MAKLHISSVTSRTARHHIFAAYPVFFLEIDAFFIRQVAVKPLHVVDLRLRPYEFLRFSMARETPFHLQRILLINGRHFVYLAVTRRTANTFCYVNAVVEIRKLRKVVNALPFDGFVIAEACPDGLEIWAVSPDLTVAVHAGLRRRHTG